MEKIYTKNRVNQFLLIFFLIVLSIFLFSLRSVLYQSSSFLQQQADLLQQQGALLDQQGTLLDQQGSSSQRQAELLQRQSDLLQQQINPSQQHISIRQFMVNSHLAQLDEDRVLIIGDSIIEGWLNEEIGQCKVVNAGFGSGTVSDILAFFDVLEARIASGDIEPSHIGSMVILIGVNDAKKRENLTANYVEVWNKDYEKMLNKALELSSGEVLVSTILPVAENMPLGDRFFDPALIEELNDSIRTIAQDKKVDLVDSNTHFLKVSTSGSNSFTTDGVHLSAAGYRVLDSIISPKLEACFPAE
ncbi:hypothetical protein IQ254_22045 [Nodosilinea sp. LEGE 07088]|uniref:SGNH/GDSL hydrolase family protein n=1 Tax=Nodosilinea sp. LEGE 07088 TaxID=2777968 RepID=UPI001881359B|nr:GDSL-type esterase/lipase family protein [Nodosilinea sp. LEGE 07088]MBE9139844.1 hypothetical protein [Nodosilinea sp. LEGE 07088]